MFEVETLSCPCRERKNSTVDEITLCRWILVFVQNIFTLVKTIYYIEVGIKGNLDFSQSSIISD